MHDRVALHDGREREFPVEVVPDDVVGRVQVEVVVLEGVDDLVRERLPLAAVELVQPHALPGP